MKKIEFNELIEKAFSMGYKYAQKEFGIVKKENKKKKREWEAKEGEKVLNDPLFIFDHGHKLEKYNNIKEGNVNESKAKQRAATRLERIISRSKVRGDKYSPDQSLNDLINKRGDEEMDSFYEPNRKQKYVGKNKKKRFYIKLLNNNKLDFIKAEKMKKEETKKENFNKDTLTKKNLKKAGLALAGTAAVVGTAYGIKKLHDKKKKREEEQNKKEED